MFRLRLTAIVLGLASLVGAPAWADSTNSELWSGQSAGGPYAGIAWSHFDLKIDNLNDVSQAVNSITHSGDDAWKVGVGRRLNPYIAIEGDYVNFGTPSDSFHGSGSDGNYRLHLCGFAPYLVETPTAGSV